MEQLLDLRLRSLRHAVKGEREPQILAAENACIAPGLSAGVKIERFQRLFSSSFHFSGKN
jgi:hypothetical protein